MMTRRGKHESNKDLVTQRNDHTQHILSILQNGATCPLNDSTNSAELDQDEQWEAACLMEGIHRSIHDNSREPKHSDIHMLDLNNQVKKSNQALISSQAYENNVAAKDNNSAFTETPEGSNTHEIRRTRSFSSLVSIPEERDVAYVVHSPKNDKENRVPTKKSGFSFDIRNLRLSFRKGGKPRNISNLLPSFQQPSMQFIAPKPTVSHPKTYPVNDSSSYYYDRPLKDCVQCKRLLKDPRFCQCPGATIVEEGGTHSSAQYYHATEMKREIALTTMREALPDSGYGSGSTISKGGCCQGDMVKHQLKCDKGLQGGMKNQGKSDSFSEKTEQTCGSSVASSIPGSTHYGTMPRNRKENLTNNGYDRCYGNQTVENLSIQRPFVSIDAFHKRSNRPPKESNISLVKTLTLPFLANKWITDIAVTSKGDLIVTDLKEVHVVDATTGKNKRIIANKSSNNKRVLAPFAITLDTHGNVLIVDHSANKLERFGIKGNHLSTISDKSLSNITSLCCNNRNDIVITTADQNHIIIYAQSSKTLTMFEPQITLRHPISVAVNPLTNDIVVGDDSSECIYALATDGRLLWTCSPLSNQTRRFYPASLCCDSNGYIFVADLYNEQIYMLECSGKFLKTVLSTGNGLMGAPAVIKTDASGHLIVSDAERTIKIFKYGENGFTMYRRFSYCPDYI